MLIYTSYNIDDLTSVLVKSIRSIKSSIPIKRGNLKRGKKGAKLKGAKVQLTGLQQIVEELANIKFVVEISISTCEKNLDQ